MYNSDCLIFSADYFIYIGADNSNSTSCRQPCRITPPKKILVRSVLEGDTEKLIYNGQMNSTGLSPPAKMTIIISSSNHIS